METKAKIDAIISEEIENLRTTFAQITKSWDHATPMNCFWSGTTSLQGPYALTHKQAIEFHHDERLELLLGKGEHADRLYFRSCYEETVMCKVIV